MARAVRRGRQAMDEHAHRATRPRRHRRADRVPRRPEGSTLFWSMASSTATMEGGRDRTAPAPVAPLHLRLSYATEAEKMRTFVSRSGEFCVSRHNTNKSLTVPIERRPCGRLAASIEVLRLVHHHGDVHGQQRFGRPRPRGAGGWGQPRRDTAVGLVVWVR
jgi:hypothetical protein